jgi:hypothetical protein
MACYACRLGNCEEAWERLEIAFDLGNAKQEKLMAPDDLDFEPFGPRSGRFEAKA